MDSSACKIFIVFEVTDILNVLLSLIAGWRKAAMILAKRWFQTFEAWSNFGNYKDLDGCLLIISFEHLKTQLRDQLLKIGRFLGVKEEYLQGEHLECVIENAKGVNKRTKYHLPLDIYDNSINQTIAVYKQRVNDILSYLDAGFVV